MSHLGELALAGLAYGCVFAIMAMGLVLTYSTSGILHLGFGAQAYSSAFVFYVLVKHGYSKPESFIAAVLLMAPLIGIILEVALFRHLSGAPLAAKLTASIGVVLAVPELTKVLDGNSNMLGPPTLFLKPDRIYVRISGFPVDGTDLSTIIAALLALVVVVGILRYTLLGLRMRSVVESPTLAELVGVHSSRVSATSWALSSLLAGLAGVVLAPHFASLSALNFTTLLVAAVAAAVAADLRFLGLAAVFGISIGIAEEIFGGYLPAGTVLAAGIRAGFPFLALALALVAVPNMRRSEGSREVSVSTRTLRKATGHHPTKVGDALRAFGALVRTPRGTVARAGLIALFIAACAAWAPTIWLTNFTQSLAFALIFLSITLLSGIAGQASLCQATFAGVGAFAAGHLAAASFHLPILVGALVGAVIAGVLGALVSALALRLGELGVALFTLAFALLADSIIFQFSWAGNGSTGINLPRPQLGSINFNSPKPFFVLMALCVAISGTIVRLLYKGTTGKYLRAIKSSPIAASSLGINVNLVRVTVFSISAALAGFGGALYGSFQGFVSPNDFNYFFSLLFVLVVVAIGSRTVFGAVTAGLAYVGLEQVFSNLPQFLSRFSGTEALLFAIGAVVFVRHPEGVVDYLRGRILGPPQGEPDNRRSPELPSDGIPTSEGAPNVVSPDHGLAEQRP